MWWWWLLLVSLSSSSCNSSRLGSTAKFSFSCISQEEEKKNIYIYEINIKIWYIHYIYNQHRLFQEPSNQIIMARKEPDLTNMLARKENHCQQRSGFVYIIQKCRRNKRKQPRTSRKSEERKGSVGHSGGGCWKAGAMGNTEGSWTKKWTELPRWCQ